MPNSTKSKNAAVNVATSTKVAYESSVILRAMERAGRNPHLKGHIHEVLVKDVKNVTNLVKGQTTTLTKSTTAEVVDLVTTKAGKVVERLQLKDTLSQSQVNELVRDVASGKYRSTQLVGTDETTKLVNAALEKVGLTKRMTSSGVSSNTTTSLAQRAGATGSGCASSAALQAAKSGGAVGAAVGAGIEVVSGVIDLVNGKRDVGDVAISTAKAAAKGYASGAAAGAAASAAGTALTTGLAAVGVGAAPVVVTVGVPIVAAMAIGWAVTEAFDWLFD